MLAPAAMALFAQAACMLVGSAALVTPPGVMDLASLASEWIEAGDGVPGVPIDCPSVANPLGSVATCGQGCPSVLGFNSWVTGSFVQGACGATLAVNNHTLDCGQHQWLPFETRRRAPPSEDPVARDVETTMRVLEDGAGTKGLLFNISLGNSGAEAILDLSLTPYLTQVGFEGWLLAWPPNEQLAARFNHSVQGKFLVTQDSFDLVHAATVLGFVAPAGAPDVSVSVANATEYNATLGLKKGVARFNATGQPWLCMFIVVAESADAALRSATSFSSRSLFSAAWRETEQRWRDRWAAAFTPGNSRYPGSLPALETEDPEVSRVYYMACVTLLSHERVTYPKISPRVYVTGYGSLYTTNVYGGSAAFFWDQSLVARLNSLLDPEWMRNYLLTALDDGEFDTNLWVELMTGQTGGGYVYAFNQVSVFWMLEAYVATTGDLNFLYNTSVGNTSISQWLERLSLLWTRKEYDSGPDSKYHPFLADYGSGALNFLECVPSYVHTVAALQAQNVRMMRSVAALREKEGKLTAAAHLRSLASNVSQAVRSRLYVPGKGFFGTIWQDGRFFTIAHVVDFLYVAEGMAEDFPAHERHEMIHFFNRELRRAHWIVALSPADPVAVDPVWRNSTMRDDHGWTGAYAAWPAYSAQALAMLNDREDGIPEAVQFLRDTAEATSSGMYGQAHYVRPGPGPPFKDIWPSGTRYAELNGASWAQVTIRFIFGFWQQLGSADVPLWRPNEPRGFTGKLHGVRLPNGTHVNICSDDAGIRYCAQLDSAALRGEDRDREVLV